MNDTFDILVSSPATFGGSAVAAGIRADAIGFVDAVGASEAEVEEAFADLLRLVPGGKGRIGLRITLAQQMLAARLIPQIADTAHVVIAWQGQTITTLPDLPGDISFYVEVPSIAAARQIKTPKRKNLAFIAVSAEAGGFAGETSGFILAQEISKHRSQQPETRWYLKGAVGPGVARACRFAGLSGVMLSDELLAFPETALPSPHDWLVHATDITDYAEVNRFDGHVLRSLMHPACKMARSLSEAASVLHYNREKLAGILGWGDPATMVWPVGQGAGLSLRLMERYKTVGRLVHALASPGQKQVFYTLAEQALKPHSSLAKALDIEFPVIQGPMTRVSDTLEFVKSVTDAGAGGTLALALMDGPTVADELKRLHALQGGKAFGVGILGYTGDDNFKSQLEAIKTAPPKYAVLAGGRADQWRQLQDAGMTTFVHTPAPKIASLFFEQGVSGIILEGRECGGHVGPNYSFALWEAVTLDMLAARDTAKRRILFAGGICDSLSAAMVGLLAGEILERGHEIGLICGSAYLATEEAVTSGAIQKGFHDQVLAVSRTALVVSALGHANRCLESPFVDDFNALRSDLIREGADTERMREALDQLLLGRLRIATRGIQREGDALKSVDADAQLREGMFMAGDVVRLIDTALTMRGLHEALSVGALAALKASPPATAEEQPSANPRDIAVIGMDVLLPGAADLETYWSNILEGRNVITEVPKERWDYRRIYRTGRARGDYTNSKWGGFAPSILFNPTDYGVPPSTVQSTAVSQLVSLELSQRALADAGYGDGGFDRSRTSVVAAAADASGFLGNQLTLRSVWPFVAADTDTDMFDRLTAWKDETFAGTITSVVAGRIANRLNFGGANFTIDAACASGLTAVSLATDELVSGRADMVLTIAIDCSQTPFHFMAFSNTGALSPTGAVRAFDQQADGTVISEGAIAMVLKRLEDAERDGDRIYGVIRGAANSSDGRVAGLTAPHPAGQKLAMRRAHDEAGTSAADIQLYEAHGTGTKVGDTSEFQSVSTMLADAGSPSRSCAIGSVKSLIGHTKTAAGLASLAKVLLALHHKVQPPHAVEKPIEGLRQDDSALLTLERPRAWPASDKGKRLAGVSAFGFGGTNCHLVVEAYDKDWRNTARGAARWPYELFALRGRNDAELLSQIELVERALAGHKDLRLRDLAYSLLNSSRKHHEISVLAAFTASDNQELLRRLSSLKTHLTTGADLAAGIVLNRTTKAEPKLAFLFPGQGVQRPNMGREAALYLHEVARSVEVADNLFSDSLPWRLWDVLYPPAAYDDEGRKQQQQRMTDSRMAQIAIGAVSIGMADFLQRLGLTPAMVGGHSFGELTALYASGALTQEDFLRIATRRGLRMYEADKGDGGMIVVSANKAKVAKVIHELDDVVIANDNAEDQVVISGTAAALELAEAKFKLGGMKTQRLPVGGAFHSPLMRAASAALKEDLKDITAGLPKCPVFSNRNGTPIDIQETPLSERIASHILEPVAFRDMVAGLLDAGADIFVDVGPGRQMAGLLQRNLPQGSTVVTLDCTSLRTLLDGIGQLWALGAPVALERLYDARQVRKLNLAALAAKPFQPPQTAFHLNPYEARPVNGSKALSPQHKLLDQDEVDAIVAAKKQAKTQLPAAAPVKAIETQPLPSLETHPDRAIAAETSTMTRSSPLASQRSPVIAQDTTPVQGFASSNGVLMAYAEYQKTMRHFLDEQEKVMRLLIGGSSDSAFPAPVETVRQTVVDMAEAPAVATQPPVSAPPLQAPSAHGQAHGQVQVQAQGQAQGAGLRQAPVAPILPVTTGFSLPAIHELVIETAVEVTGYPADMLALDQDIEAELGIDSIKRLELLEKLDRKLEGKAGAKLQDAVADITRLRTLQGWISVLGELLSGSTVEHASPASVVAASVRDSIGLSAEAVLKLVIETAVDVTGYPADMLDLEQDIEAELGIDSIKRLELLEKLDRKLEGKAGAKLQDAVADITRLRTLQGWITVLSDMLSMSDPATTTHAPVPATVASAMGVSAETILNLVIETAVDVSGYPADMLNLEQDIEAELGIDSIKRLELLEKLDRKLEGQAGAKLQEAAADITRLRTLRGWTSVLADILGGSALAATSALASPAAAAPVPTVPPVVTAPVTAPQPASRTNEIDQAGHLHVLPHPRRDEMPADPSEMTDATPCPCYVMQACPSDISLAEKDWLAGLHIVAQGDPELTEYVANGMKARGASVVVIPVAILADRAATKAAVAKAREKYGAVRGIMHLSAANIDPLDWDGATWKKRAQIEAKSLQTLIHSSLDDLSQPVQGTAGRVIAVSTFGGHFARDLDRSEHGSALGGSHQGLLKSLSQEKPELMLKAVDLDPQMEPGDLALQLVDEYLTWGGRQEIGYPGGQRIVFDVVDAPMEDESLSLPNDAVIVATGGGLGITAALIRRIARPGHRIVLLGRTAFERITDEDILACKDETSLRKLMIERGRARKASPAEINAETASIRRRLELGAMLDGLRQGGIMVDYDSVDVRDGAAMAAAIGAIKTRYGRIDVAIHGAGVIEDSYFGDKKDDSFDRVFDTKVIGAVNLIAALDLDTLKALAFFSSIAGRFGNSGQSDYAAANEVLTRLALQLKSTYPDLSVVAYNWGPWTGAGMANPAVNKQFLARGIVPITVEKGTAVAETALSNAPSPELIMGKGDWRVGEVDEKAYFNPQTSYALN
ncbi:SDR family NAD(P)-dependent oxidoreductase [Allorhizobium sp. BGMRC 0089]|uniref:type I polyketide synthase n=1 Tax=Allorhizobium sonneratiae TaxID=2934936 RepID=UPI00203460DE|nr:type I polyketide synthase [Allorhizobium sonneratiae]MCM2292383.1 SDR family NAD(P)-dependent oxidoreductase [Allorhizobium sonneratiae]